MNGSTSARAIVSVVVLFQCSLTLAAPYSKTFAAKDTFINPTDPSPAAQAALDGAKWKPGDFEVTSALPAEGMETEKAIAGGYDAIVRFPSPLPIGDKITDNVVMEWFVARDADGKPIEAPAMLVLHILQNDPLVPRAFARSFSKAGIHAFVMYMPHYGPRRKPGVRPDVKTFLEGARQAVADARRARDAINALPNIKKDKIGIQGTSLGGFICTGAASLDGVFNIVMPTLAAGDLPTLFVNGKNEVASIRKAVEKSGMKQEDFLAIITRIDPLLLAHRLDPKKTWMFNAEGDEVIPADNARALAKAIGLPSEQHIWMPGGHVTCAIHLPVVMPMMIEKIKAAAK
jgi:hypothetical protein